MKPYRTIITHPDFKDPGGVSAYYKNLHNKFNIPIEHHIIGKRFQEKGIFMKVIRMLRDYTIFVKHLKKNKSSIVHVNPSLDLKSVLRDGILVLLARSFGKKVVVFFHGWQKSFALFIERNCLCIFKFLFKGAHAFIVLSDEFKKQLEHWGFTQPIYVEVTVVDDAIIEGLDVYESIIERQKADKWQLLFLSRIIKDKGIYEILEAYLILQRKYPMMELVIAGSGDELENVRSFVRDNNMPRVKFLGYVKGEEKSQVFKNSHIYCLPSYSEGMPISVVEAMTFGLPVITRPVGGIRDFFENGVHGFITPSKDPDVFASLIERLFLDRELYKNISLHNYNYAQSKFLASGAAFRLEEIYKTVSHSLYFE